MIVLAADFILSATEPKGYPKAGPPEIAFCGRSNVGKSSCLNELCQRKQLARVSGTPGRTRLINFFDVRVATKTRSGARGPEHAVRLVDLPGYGFAAGPKEDKDSWKKMIERYLTGREPLKALVILVDGELGAQPNDREMIDWGRTLPGRKLLVVATKLDRLSRSRQPQQLEKIAKSLDLPLPDVIGFSAKDHFGVDELWRAVLGAVGE